MSWQMRGTNFTLASKYLSGEWGSGRELTGQDSHRPIVTTGCRDRGVLSAFWDRLTRPVRAHPLSWGYPHLSLLHDTDIAVTFAGKSRYGIILFSHWSALSRIAPVHKKTNSPMSILCALSAIVLCKPLHVDMTFTTWLPRRGGRVSPPFWCSRSTRKSGSFFQVLFITKGLCSRGQLLNSTKYPWLQWRADGMPKCGGGGRQCKLAFLCSFI